MTSIGIDNGASGTIGIIADDGSILFEEIPTQDSLHYGKRGSVTQRLNRQAFKALLQPYCTCPSKVRIRMERPFTGKFINAVLPAHRVFEAELCCLEDLGLGFEIIDSGLWQAPLLGNVKGSAELKKASMLRGLQLYPHLQAAIKKHKDADGLLIAHHLHYHAQS